MFRASPSSSQIDLFSNVEQFLRERDQEKLNDPNAWHNIFLDQVTNRIAEERFAALFDEQTGRPNAPIRLLVAMLILKEGFGWSDEQLFEAVHFNLLAERVRQSLPAKRPNYAARHASYDLAKLRGKQLLERVERSRRYRICPYAVRILAGMLGLRERVIEPVLAGLGKPRVGRPPKHIHPIDQHYQTLQQELRRAFETLGLVAA